MRTTKNSVLVTGGGSGIGKALCRLFWSEGNEVIAIGRNEDALVRLAKEMPGIRTEVLDITRLQDLGSLQQKYPQVNILVNNAGIQYNYEFGDSNKPIDLIETEIKTNLLAPMYLTKLFLPQLAVHKHAAIVNVSSSLGYVPKSSAPVYSAAKAGLHMFSKALRWQLENKPVRVFEIVPSLVDTEMTRGRGKHKISPEDLALEFWKDFKKDRYEVHIGKVKQLLMLNRLSPRTAENILKG